MNEFSELETPHIENGFIDTHAHIDGPEFDDDRDAMVERALSAGVRAIFVPAINVATTTAVLAVCRKYRGFAWPMAGLHPEEVKDDYKEALAHIHDILDNVGYVSEEERRMGALQMADISPHEKGDKRATPPFIAIGEVGIDYYWSRDFADEQLDAFERQVEWSIQTRLPLMVHCRKAQNEMVKILRKYAADLPGGVFHCFTGNAYEAEELLQFRGFMLGIGGVLTFKKSNLPATLAAAVPLQRIVLETDSPYMAPVPMRGKRNESAFVRYVLDKLAECYNVGCRHVADVTNTNVRAVFGI